MAFPCLVHDVHNVHISCFISLHDVLRMSDNFNGCFFSPLFIKLHLVDGIGQKLAQEYFIALSRSVRSPLELVVACFSCPAQCCHMGVEPKIGGKKPKWMVKIMENP